MISLEKNLLIVDTSYLIFYRYHALKVWYGHARPDESIDSYEDVTECEDYMERYRKTFFQTLDKIVKETGVPKSNIIFARDCSGPNNWRSKIFPKYKQNRDYSNFNGKSLFDWTVDNLLVEWPESSVLKFECIEADDIAAVITKFVHEKRPETKTTIVTNDNDYLQLLKYPNVKLINLKMESLEKRSSGNPQHDLMKKIIMGDPSDNIPKLFKGCGPKTFQKFMEDPELLNKKLDESDEIEKQFSLNELLVDFDKIPSNKITKLLDWCRETFVK